MRRREFLRGLGAATLSGIALPSMGFGCAAGDPLAAALAGFFSDREAARAVGSAYLAATPGEGSAQLLLDRLAGPQRVHWEALAESDPGALYPPPYAPYGKLAYE